MPTRRCIHRCRRYGRTTPGPVCSDSPACALRSPMHPATCRCRAVLGCAVSHHAVPCHAMPCRACLHLCCASFGYLHRTRCREAPACTALPLLHIISGFGDTHLVGTRRESHRVGTRGESHRIGDRNGRRRFGCQGLRGLYLVLNRRDNTL